MQRVVTLKDCIDWPLFLKGNIIWIFTVPKMGFIAGKRIKDMIKMFTYNKNLEELDIPTAVVATDILKGGESCFYKWSDCGGGSS